VIAVANWALNKKRGLMHRRGIAYSRKESSSTVHRTVDEHSPNWRLRRPAKADLRQQAVEALEQWQRQQKELER
jgi:hypothetical protein